MISERQLSTLYTSFWVTALPLAESTVREMNLRAYRAYEPLEALSPAEFNGFVNELAFRLVEASHRSGSTDLDLRALPEVYASTESYITRLPRPSLPSSKTERDAAIRDAVAIGQRLGEMIGHARGEMAITFRPPFVGCGMLDACEGDILIGDDLWEVKSGDRHFRQPDIRQILTYCALNHAARTRPIDRYSLVNPRAGVVAAGSVTELINDVAGCDPDTLFDEIIACVTMREASM